MAEAHPIKHNKLLTRAIIASQFAPPFMFSGVAVALPTLGADLHAGATSLGLIETIFLAGQLAFLLPIGRLADSSDKRVLYKAGLLCFGITSLLIGFSSSVHVIMGLRFVQGITSAIFAATGPAILAELVPHEQRGRAYGSSIGAMYAGLTLGPICAGFLIAAWNWRAVFMGGAAILIVGCLLIHLMMPAKWRHPPRNAVHLPSAALVLGAVLCLVGGSAMLHYGAIGYATLALGLLLAAAFVRLQRGLEFPLLNIEALMKNHPLRNALFVQLLLYVNAYAAMFMLSIYMQVSLGHSAQMAGQVLASGTVLMAITAPFAGRLADRYKPTTISGFGVACVLIATLVGWHLNDHSTIYHIALMLAIQGVGFALFSSPNMAIIMNSVPAHKTSMASALGAKARSLGIVIGMLVAAVLISLHFGDDPVSAHPARFIGTMVTAFTVLSALTALALVVSFLTRTRPPAQL